MPRYIDAKKIDFKLGVPFQVADGELFIGIRDIRKVIAQTPTEDVVKVVRCRDCKYWQDNNGGYPHEECRWGKDETPDENDYCSCGERR